MAITTMTMTGMNIGTLIELGNTLSQAAATAGPENRLSGTFTLADTATNTGPWTITSVDAAGTTRTFKVG